MDLKEFYERVTNSQEEDGAVLSEITYKSVKISVVEEKESSVKIKRKDNGENLETLNLGIISFEDFEDIVARIEETNPSDRAEWLDILEGRKTNH